MSFNEALGMAESSGMNLVEMQPSDIPVCKIMDYNKFCYDQKKKSKSSKPDKTETKEVRMGPSIAVHDMQIKAKMASRLLSEGDKVKISMRHKGREMAFMRNNVDKLKSITQYIEGNYTVESGPVINGNQIIMVIAPSK